MSPSGLWAGLPRFVVLDVEGNGQQPPDLVEVACVELLNGSVRAKASWLIKPPRPITPIVHRIHGIGNPDVNDRPAFSVIAPEIERFIHDSPVVAHNARIDAEALARHMADRWHPGVIYDTLKLAKAVWPGLKSYSLDALLGYTNIDQAKAAELGTRHRALFDATLTAELFLSLINSPSGPESTAALGTMASILPPSEADSPMLF